MNITPTNNQQSFNGGFRAMTCKNPISAEEYTILKQKMAKVGGVADYLDAQVSSVSTWKRKIKGVKKYMEGYSINLVQKINATSKIRQFEVSKRLGSEKELATPFNVLSRYIDRLAKKYPSKEGEDIVVDFDFPKDFQPWRKAI